MVENDASRFRAGDGVMLKSGVHPQNRFMKYEDRYGIVVCELPWTGQGNVSWYRVLFGLQTVSVPHTRLVRV